MPEDFSNAIGRRQFLKSGLMLAGGLALLGPRRGWAADNRSAPWAFLSDTHIPADTENNYRGFYPYRNLEKILPQVAACGPKGLVVTGDLARLTGEVGDYENLSKLLTPVTDERPAYLALGNHDNLANFQKVFAKPSGERQPVKKKHVLTVDAGPVRFLLLDSLLATNLTGGLLGKAQRTWLEGYLKAGGDTPTILFFHHTLGDADGDLLDANRLFDVIRPARTIKAVVFGHSHAYGFTELDGIHLINLPATAYTFGKAQPVGWVEARLSAEGAELVLHAIAGNTEIDGQTKTLRWR